MSKLNKKIIKIAIFISFVYICFHITYGERGLLALNKLYSKMKDEKIKLEKVETRYSELKKRLALLTEDNYDVDYIDELCRRFFGFSAPDEMTIILEISE